MEKEGYIKKRSGRMHQWTTRYFYLQGSKLSYKMKSDSTNLKGSFDLVPGCVVTEILEESLGPAIKKGKKIFSFWVVWPHDKRKPEDDKNMIIVNAEDSDDENNKDHHVSDLIDKEKQTGKVKDLKQIVESEVMTQKRQKYLVEEQLEMHQAHDSNVKLGVTVAAVAVGGVVIGALTAGIGLMPYLTVVGITAVAGGGAAAFQMQWRRPSDSRLIMACDTMEEAIQWKSAIESQVMHLDDIRKPMLPPSADANIISSMLSKSTAGGSWKRVELFEGMRILEHIANNQFDRINFCYGNTYLSIFGCPIYSAPGYAGMGRMRCRKAQQSVMCSPFNAFLTLMQSHWPKSGSAKVVKEIDDHVDIIGVEMKINKYLIRRMCFSRFWKLDDDGIYLITFNNLQSEDFTSSVTGMGKNSKEPSVYGVISIAPRQDVANYDCDVNECIVTCICEVSTEGNWQCGEMVEFMDSFLKDNIIDLKEVIFNNKYFNADGILITEKNNPVVPIIAPTPVESSIILSNTKKPNRMTRYLSSSNITQDNSSSENKRKHNKSRGVVTTQPGLEDASVDAYNQIAVANAQLYSDPLFELDQHINPLRAVTDTADFNRHPIQHSKSLTSSLGLGAQKQKDPKSKSSFFKRNIKQSTEYGNENLMAIIPPLPLSRANSSASPTAFVNNFDKEGYSFDPINTSPSSRYNKFVAKSRSPSPSRRKTSREKRNMNSEASSLRDQIAAKEYEVERLARTIRKKIIVSPASTLPSPSNSNAKDSNIKHEKHHITVEGMNELQKQQNELQTNLQLLRDQYFQLTGEHHKRSRLFRSFNKYGNTHLTDANGNSAIASTVPAAQLSSNPSNEVTRINTHVINNSNRPFRLTDNINRPPHWLSSTYQLEENNNWIRKKSSETIRNNIFLLVLFAISVILTYFLGNFFAGVNMKLSKLFSMILSSNIFSK
eukprot:gene8164-11049_t